MFESVRFGRLDLERQTTLNSAGSVTLCDVAAVADSYSALVMCRTLSINYCNVFSYNGTCDWLKVEWCDQS